MGWKSVSVRLCAQVPSICLIKSRNLSAASGFLIIFIIIEVQLRKYAIHDTILGTNVP
jgi:hypothetical protein